MGETPMLHFFRVSTMDLICVHLCASVVSTHSSLLRVSVPPCLKLFLFHDNTKPNPCIPIIPPLGGSPHR
jgi:hypothetical protein